jgi:hypothetical protein
MHGTVSQPLNPTMPQVRAAYAARLRRTPISSSPEGRTADYAGLSALLAF